MQYLTTYYLQNGKELTEIQNERQVKDFALNIKLGNKLKWKSFSDINKIEQFIQLKHVTHITIRTMDNTKGV